ncbi:MAG: hypothetical protein ACP5E3_09185, partial [Bacteroidales bacterium]
GKEEGYLDVKDVGPAVDVFMMIMQSVEIPFFLQEKYDLYENTLHDLINMIASSLKARSKSD